MELERVRAEGTVNARALGLRRPLYVFLNEDFYYAKSMEHIKACNDELKPKR